MKIKTTTQLKTTPANHQKMIQLIKKVEPANFMNLVDMNKEYSEFMDTSYEALYWFYISVYFKNKTPSFFEIFEHMFECEINVLRDYSLFYDSKYFGVLFEALYDFFGDELMNLINIDKVGNAVVFGNSIQHSKRAINRLNNNNLDSAIVYDNSYYKYTESDYETAIQIDSVDVYNVPAYKVYKINENMFYIRKDESNDKEYYKSHTRFVGYGTHWM